MVSAEDATKANWVCASISLAILLTRIVLTRWRDGRFSVASIFVVASIGVLVTRIVVIHIYIHDGTAGSVLAHQNNNPNLTNIKTGSILALVARFLDTSYYWLQISILLIFYSHLCRDFHWRNTIKVCWGLICITYVAIALTTFLECQPFHLWWQIEPNPGNCTKAYIQLLLQGICNIILDLFLLAISYPILQASFHSRSSWSQRLRVGALVILGLFSIVVTCVRIAYVYKERSYQPVRSFWASIQVLVVTFVANTPVIYGTLRLARRQKTELRTRRASASQPDTWLSSGESPLYSTISPQLPPIAQVRDSASEKGIPAWSRHEP